MIRALIAEHREVLRAGLVLILGSEPDIEVAATVATGDALPDALAASGADVCLLDPRLPGGGYALVERLGRDGPATRLLLFGAAGDREVLRSIALGALGHVPAETSAEELVRAVRTVAAGGRHLGAARTPLVGLRLAGADAGEPHERLSPRELDVLLRIADGASLTEIADELGVSLRTVSTFRARVLDKLGLSRNAELTRYVVEHGLAP
ncbi:MAG: response regulator transcription factor [Chloroflexota bacterium]